MLGVTGGPPLHSGRRRLHGRSTPSSPTRPRAIRSTEPVVEIGPHRRGDAVPSIRFERITHHQETVAIASALGLLAVVLLILGTAFFVAAEFALVAIERSRLEALAADGDRRAQRALAMLQRLSFYLSGAQLGVTLMSLVLGFVAEPTIARLIEPLLEPTPRRAHRPRGLDRPGPGSGHHPEHGGGGADPEEHRHRSARGTRC